MRGVTPACETIDVLVVGLGPAGASAARAAAQDGATVLAIDRKRQAGVPVQCAEFVPKLIGQKKRVLAASLQQPISEMRTFVESGPPHVESHFHGHMIDRARFDAALADRASEAGARCEFGVALRNIDAAGRSVLLDGRRVHAKVIVGADGPHSVVGRSVGCVNTELVETRQVTVTLLQRFEATDIFLAADIPGGYGWLFPKSCTANLGVGVAPAWRARLKSLLDRLHMMLVSNGRVGQEVLRHTGGAIPVGGMIGPVAHAGPTNVLLAGDAAGLANPITGAGINAAVQSGACAGKAAAAAAAGSPTAVPDYAEELADLFKPSLDRALARRRELLRIYGDGRQPTTQDLQRGWIAFPHYWAA